jgi:hypothetical protein
MMNSCIVTLQKLGQSKQLSTFQLFRLYTVIHASSDQPNLHGLRKLVTHNKEPVLLHSSLIMFINYPQES